MQRASSPAEVSQQRAGDDGIIPIRRRIAAALSVGDRAALARAAADQAALDDDWRTWALAQHRQPWGEGALAFQSRLDAAARAPSKAAEEERKRQHASRQHMGRLTVTLLRRGLAAEEIALRLRSENATLSVPLPEAVLLEVVRRAVEHLRHG